MLTDLVINLAKNASTLMLSNSPLIDRFLTKGVVLTLNNVISQIECMIDPWGWSNQDQILHILPLHHTHGIVNCLLCPLQVGASIDMLDGFDPKEVIDKLVAGEVNVFMAVPTVYAKLLEYIRKGIIFFYLQVSSYPLYKPRSNCI